MPIYKLDIERNMITLEGRQPVIMAAKTTVGWRWFTHVGRASRNVDFKTSEEALIAGAKALRIKFIDETEQLCSK